MRSLFALTAIWFLPMLAYCQTDNSDPAVPARTYSLLRENEDWSWLANPALREDYLDPIKYLPLGRNGWYVTLGGEIREVLEQVVMTTSASRGIRIDSFCNGTCCTRTGIWANATASSSS